MKSAIPLVVVVTPVYNGGAFLRETMDCVQAQTWKNLIHLVVDNASTDDTAEILADYASGRVPVRVVRHTTLLPQIPNWNSAIEAIPQGADWFRILCADDTMHPDAIERMVMLGETDPQIGAVGCAHDINGEVQDLLWDPERTVFDGPEAQRLMFENRGLIIAPHVLFRTSTIEKERPFFETDVSAFDTDAVLRVLSKWKWGVVHAHLAFTREHTNTVTAQQVAPKRLHLLDWYQYLQRYAQSAYGPEEGARMLRRYRRHYLRRLLNVRRQGGGEQIWKLHMERLARIGEQPSKADLIDASIDKILIALRLRPDWMSYPW